MNLGGLAAGINQSDFGDDLATQAGKAGKALRAPAPAPAQAIPTDTNHPMSDAEHPFWDVMAQVVGANGGAGQPGVGPLVPQPVAPGANGPIQGLEDGGEVEKPTYLGAVKDRVKEMVGLDPYGTRKAALAAGPTHGGKTVDDIVSQAEKGYENGGVVSNYGSRVIAPEFKKGPAIPTGPNSGIVAASTDGQIKTYANGGVVAAYPSAGPNHSGMEGQVLTMADGGGVPDTFQQAQVAQPQVMGRAAGLVSGFASGQAMGRNIINAWHEHEARKAISESAGADAAVSDQNPQGGLDQPSLLDRARQAVEDVFHHLHSGNLDDNGKPNGQQAVPVSGAPAPAAGPAPAGATPAGAAPAVPAAGAPQAPAPAAGAAPAANAPPAGGAAPAGGAPAQPAASPVQQQATQAEVTKAAQDPQAQAGIPEKSPASSSQPHSLTAEYWKESDQRIAKAVAAAAMAGQDPNKVYESLTALRTANIQGHVLKNLAAANTALLSGDEDSVRKALANVNYYLPNGQGITFKNATADDVAADKTGQTKVGQLMYRNPMYGLYGHQGEPEYTSVTPQHLQLLGQAALDPRTVQETILKTYSAQAQAQKEMLQAQGEYQTGEGRRLMGAAAWTKAKVSEQMADVDRRLKIAEGNLKQEEANWYRDRTTGNTGGRPKITVANLRQAQNDAATYVDSIVQGQKTTAPVLDASGAPNLSPGAGKPIPNAQRIPTVFQNLTPDQQENVKVLAGQINSANVGIPGMNVAKAADLAARITAYQTHPTTHVDPQTHKVVKNFVYDPQNGTAHIWVGNAYENVYLRPNVADEEGESGRPQASSPVPSGEGETPDMPNNMG